MNIDLEMIKIMAWDDIRRQRDTMIKKADIAINKLEDAGKNSQEWRSYRQALRDIPQNYNDAELVEWPQVPSLNV